LRLYLTQFSFDDQVLWGSIANERCDSQVANCLHNPKLP